MPTVWIPSQLREYTKGEDKVQVAGETLRQVIENLETQYPGIRARLCDEEGRLRSNLAVAVDGVISQQGMRHKLHETSQIHFLPAISGGCLLTEIV